MLNTHLRKSWLNTNLSLLSDEQIRRLEEEIEKEKVIDVKSDTTKEKE